MRFRLGVLIGFGAGYYLGAKAGRERYEQLNRTIRRIKRSDAYETAVEKAKEAADTAVEKAKETISSATGNGNGTTPDLPLPDPWPTDAARP